jgi:hypothetical protein
MKITNASDTVVKPSTSTIVEETVQLSDLLPSGEAQQYQDGIKNVIVKPGEYVIVPNLYACNSIALRHFWDDTDWASGVGTAGYRLVLDNTVEPTGADPSNEVNGPILGLAAL